MSAKHLYSAAVHVRFCSTDPETPPPPKPPGTPPGDAGSGGGGTKPPR